MSKGRRGRRPARVAPVVRAGGASSPAPPRAKDTTLQRRTVALGATAVGLVAFAAMTLLGVLLLGAAASPAVAQDAYPSRLVTLVVPSPAET